jgi:DnaJ-domain-containing protein 1
MSTPQAEQLEQLKHLCHRLLRAGPLSEFQLISRVRHQQPNLLPARTTGDSLALYRLHFTLFHALYRLQEWLLVERKGVLRIEPLAIAIEPYRAAQEGVVEYDPQRDYYLDLDNLARTGRSEVEQLLASFWRRLGSGGGAVDEALAQLGLQVPCSYREVKVRYRYLVMENHPDRGGDAQAMSRINSAMRLLESHYNGGTN